jgi:uncharacterized protein (TIGR03067 family)
MSNDLDLLQGTWTVTALEVDGQKTPAAMLAHASIVVKGSRFTSSGMGAVYKGKLVLDATVSPRRLDLRFEAGPEKGNTNLCIYDLDGEEWRLCIATRGTVRPSGFVSPPGSGIAVQTLTRAAPKEKTRAAGKAGPATEFEGEWRMVSALLDGQPMDESAVKWVKRVTRGNETTVSAGPQMMFQFQFTHDVAASPKTVDYLHTAGANEGKSQHGIYEFEGGLLKVCLAPPGAPRPAKFESSPGDGRMLTVWRRA